MIETPNTNSLDYKIFKKKHWGGYHAPRHWYIFEPKTIKFLQKKLNFKILSMHPYTMSNFWVWTFHSITEDLFGKKISNFFFPPVKILYGGIYSFILLSFFSILEKIILAATGKANSIWFTIKKKT